jgi:hypothetical protein
MGGNVMNKMELIDNLSGRFFFYDFGFTVINVLKQSYAVVDGVWFLLNNEITFDEFSKICLKNQK